MSERTEYAAGTPSWIDLQTSDQAAAKTFYTELFGWTYDDQPMDEGAVYSLANLKGKNVAAIAPLGDQAAAGVPPHWNTYVTVTDVDASAEIAQKAGGTLFAGPFDVMDAGRMAVVADPTGAVVALWQAKNHIGAALVNEPGAFGWSELITPDIPAAAAFYQKLFGWTSNPLEGMDYTEFKLNGEGLAGAMNPPMPGIPPVWTVYFQVADTDAIVAKATALGASVMVPPTDIPPGRFAVLADPQGAMFNIITMNPT
jgi:predicted enzyme related to lactoylglutathione lyase